MHSSISITAVRISRVFPVPVPRARRDVFCLFDTTPRTVARGAVASWRKGGLKTGVARTRAAVRQHPGRDNGPVTEFGMSLFYRDHCKKSDFRAKYVLFDKWLNKMYVIPTNDLLK
jgi:hypothetical protein